MDFFVIQLTIKHSGQEQKEEIPPEPVAEEKKYCCEKHLKLFEQASNSIR